MRSMLIGLTACFTFFMTASLRAEDTKYSPVYESCLKKAVATVDILNCIATEMTFQDKRLNKAYQSALKAFSSGRQEKLKDAQRLWIKYRDGNCEVFVNASGGTMDSLNTASCFLDMTAKRAKELEDQAEQLEGL